MKGFAMDQYPSFVAPIDPKKVEADKAEAEQGRGADDPAEPAVYADLFSAREGKNDAR